MKVKMFRIGEYNSLEDTINDWLDKNNDNIEICNILQSSHNIITISIFYKELIK